MWFHAISQSIDRLNDALLYYENELTDAANEVKLSGNLEKNMAALPGVIEYRFNQLQEMESILEHLNILLKKQRAISVRNFMESYNRSMSLREAEKWSDSEQNIVDMASLTNEVAYIRNKYLGIMKGLENKSFQLNNITKLRTAGMEDAEIG